MSFDQSVITSGPTCTQLARHELRVRWTSSASAGTTYQVYIDKVLSWSGTALFATFPLGPTRMRIWVGAVAVGEETTDFSSSLTDPLGSGDCATLNWYGGRYLDVNLASFAIYAGALPLAAVSGTPIASVPSAPNGIWPDGFGRGRFGQGSFGYAEVAYTWTSQPLAAGVWNFAVAPVGSAGNVGTASAITITIAAPPQPPTPLGLGKGRLGYSYISSTRTLTLNWNASP